MSQFSGKQYRGAARVLRELKREQAEARQKEFNKKKAFEEMRKLEDQVFDEMDAGENTGPAVPGLVKRKRKVTKH